MANILAIKICLRIHDYTDEVDVDAAITRKFSGPPPREGDLILQVRKFPARPWEIGVYKVDKDAKDGEELLGSFREYVDARFFAEQLLNPSDLRSLIRAALDFLWVNFRGPIIAIGSLIVFGLALWIMHGLNII